MTSTWSTLRMPLGTATAVIAACALGSGCGDGEAGLGVEDGRRSGGAGGGTGGGTSLDTGVLEWKNANDAQIPGEIAAVDLPEVFSFTVCSVLSRCRPEIWADVFPEVRGCVAHFTKVLHDRDFGGFARSARENKVAFDGRRVASCLDEYLDTSCNELLPERMICADAMPGRVREGDACVADFECEPGTHCRTLSCPGICVAKGELGATCSTGIQCQDGLECVDTRCVMPLLEGARCNPNRDICANGRLCVRLDELYAECASWEDVYSLKEGEPCDPAGGRTCELGLHCIYGESGERSCARPAQADGPCQLGDPDPCPADQYCNALRMRPYSGRCMPLVEAGGMCTSGIECVIGTTCVDVFGTSCVPLQEIGEQCNVNSACYSGNCNTMIGECAYEECVLDPPD